MKIWVLSTCIPGDRQPCFPQVFLKEDAAEDAAERAILEEWSWRIFLIRPPIDYRETKRRARPVVNWQSAQEIMMNLDDEEARYGAWEITVHHLD